MKKLIAVLIAAVMIVSLAGCELFPKEKAFSVEEMLITLNDTFTEAEFEGYTKAFDSRKVAVFVLRAQPCRVRLPPLCPLSSARQSVSISRASGE